MGDERAEALLLLDVVRILKETAFEAKRAAAASSEADRPYALGRLMAMHEVISLLQRQAEAFGIDAKAIGLDGIDPERDLL